MSKTVVVSVVALVCLAGPITWAVARDRDNDKLPDRWERRHGLSTHKKSGRGDPDHDKLRNRREHRLRLNPRRADTDRDGLRDRAEIKKYKTNPRRKDTDGDGVGDGAEVRAGTDPKNPASRPSNPSPPAPPPPGGGPIPPGAFPSPATTGVPAGWTPTRTVTSDMIVRTPGAVIQDIQIDNADLYIFAPNVTVRRVRIRGGRLLNAQTDVCEGQGMVVEDSTIEPPPGQNDPSTEPYVVGEGGYTLRRVKIWRVGDGPRVSYKPEGCGPVTIEDTFISVTQAGNPEWHTDGLQAWYGNHLNIRNVTIDARGDRLGASAAFFYPNQNNTSATVDRLLLLGGAYSFRLGEPATVSGLRIVNDSWIYGPIDVKCSVVSSWDATIVTMTDNYQVDRTIRTQPCNTEGGN
jgi:hypothetical protein